MEQKKTTKIPKSDLVKNFTITLLQSDAELLINLYGTLSLAIRALAASKRK